ncbi:hypothetical protein SUGI_0407130 [Cryptomeria japonica]|nr:hypothetical protein SUGI_0407130 [Cryptomeria japonica]
MGAANIVELVNRYKPHLAMIAIQFDYAGMYIITSAALSNGMNQFVFVVYRHLIATLVISPFAYFLEREKRPPMTLPVFCRIFLLALCGITINQNVYFAGLHYTSPTFTSAMNNLVPVVTFLMAITFRLESLNITSMGGQAKITGTLISFCGATIMTLYKGPPVSSLFSSTHLGWNSLFQIPYLVSENMKVGPLLLLGSCVLWSSWIIMQAETARLYPAQMSLTALMCFLATIQSTIATLIFEHDPAVWKVEWNLELLSVTYTGIVCSGITFYLSAWVIHKKGPVFMSMFNPLVTVIVALLGAIILHESLHVGSAGGAVLIVGGLYCLLWGKGQDREEKKVKAKGKEALGVNQTEEVQSKTNSNKYIDIEEPLLGTS